MTRGSQSGRGCWSTGTRRLCSIATGRGTRPLGGPWGDGPARQRHRPRARPPRRLQPDRPARRPARGDTRARARQARRAGRALVLASPTPGCDEARRYIGPPVHAARVRGQERQFSAIRARGSASEDRPDGTVRDLAGGSASRARSSPVRSASAIALTAAPAANRGASRPRDAYSCLTRDLDILSGLRPRARLDRRGPRSPPASVTARLPLCG